METGLDREPVSIAFAMRAAKECYDKNTYEHALRVATFVSLNETIPPKYRDECVCLAIMHDLLEDTDFSPIYLPENFKSALEILSKPKDIEYNEYIKNIKNTGYTNWRMCAYWVKLADMKDHLTQTETLTEKLKEKYFDALKYLL